MWDLPRSGTELVSIVFTGFFTTGTRVNAGGFFTPEPPGKAAPHLLYPLLRWWTFRLLPCLGCNKQCCSEHRVRVSFRIMTFSGYEPRSGTAGSCGSSIFSFLKNLHTVLQRVCYEFYITTNSVGGVPFLYILSRIYRSWTF